MHPCRTLAIALAGVALAVSLAACGGKAGGSSAPAASGSATTVPSGAPSGAPSGGRSGGPGGNGRRNSQFFRSAAVQQCLKAAGISVPTGRPSGFGTRTPGGSFSPGTRPSGRTSGARRSGAPFGGGDMGKIQQALKACGITMPSRPPRANGTPAAS